jgi:ribose-phosphate pyrophosphokinase
LPHSEKFKNNIQALFKYVCLEENMNQRRGDIAIVACRNGVETANCIISHLNSIVMEGHEQMTPISLLDSESQDFKDGEIITRLRESVRGKDVYIVQNTLDPRKPELTSHNIMELMIMIDNVRRSDAAHVSVIIPYLSYCKQERRQGRQPVSLKLLIDMLETAGAERLITMDLHSPATESFSKSFKIQNLFASPLLMKHILEDMAFKGVFVAPDPNAGKTARHYSKLSGLPMAICYKYKKPDSMHDIDDHTLLGDVKNKDALIIDDQTAGSGTLLGTAKLLKSQGAKQVCAAVTHAMFLGDAEQSFRKAVDEGMLSELIITNTLLHSKEFLDRNPYLKVIDALRLVSEAIYEIHTDGSISSLYEPRLRKEMFG